MLGGLARRVTFVDQLKAKQNPLIIVDSGRMFQDPRVEEDAEKVSMNARLISRAYGRMGVHAVNVGDLELLQGIPFLKEQASQGLNLISANLVDASGKNTIFPPYFIYNVENFRIAFFGLLSSDMVPEIRKAIGEDAVAIDPIKTAREMVSQLRKEADVVILLSSLGLDKEREIISKIPGIHFVMGGHEGRFYHSMLKEGETFITQSYWAGMYTGRLDLTLRNATSSFHDAGEKFRIKKEITDLDRRLERIKSVLNEGESNVLEFTFQKVVKKRAQLQETLDSLNRLPYTGNLFQWQMVPLDNSYKEDLEVVDWIRKSGFTENAKN